MARARFSVLFDQEFVEQFGDLMIDVFGAVIAVETADNEREALQ